MIRQLSLFCVQIRLRWYLTFFCQSIIIVLDNCIQYTYFGRVVTLIIQVCIGSACHLKGAYNVINSLQQLINEKGLQEQITLKGAFCLGQCTDAVSVKIDDGPVLSVSDSAVEQFFDMYAAGRY